MYGPRLAESFPEGVTIWPNMLAVGMPNRASIQARLALFAVEDDHSRLPHFL